MPNEKPMNQEDESPFEPKQNSPAPPTNLEGATQTASVIPNAITEMSSPTQIDSPKPNEPLHNKPLNLSEKTKKFGSEKAKNFLTEISFWLPIVTSFTGIATFVLLMIQSFYMYQSVVALQEQLTLQRESLEKDLPAQFALEYEEPGIYERVFVVNPGKVELSHVMAEMKFYFLFRNGNIKTRLQLESDLSKDSILFKRVQDANLFMSPQDISNFLGGQRRFEIPAGLKAQEKQILNNLSPSLIDNAVRLSQVLDCEIIIRWRIEYTEKFTRRKNTSYVFSWIHLPKSQSARRREGAEREDLTGVIGGKKVIADITKIEEESKEILFGTE